MKRAAIIFGSVAALAATYAAVTLTRDRDVKPDLVTVSSPVPEVEATSDDIYPVGASEVDKRLISEWGDLLEACVGGSNSTKSVCAARDAAQNKLEARGWCWGAPSDENPAVKDWHRCGEYQSDRLTEARVDEKVENWPEHAPFPVTSIHDLVINEERRLKTPLLTAYEAEIAPIVRKMAMSAIVTKCGIKGSDWFGFTVRRLDNYLTQPRLMEMRRRLSPADLKAADDYRGNIINSMNLSYRETGDRATECRELAALPFVNNEAAFQP